MNSHDVTRSILSAADAPLEACVFTVAYTALILATTQLEKFAITNAAEQNLASAVAQLDQQMSQALRGGGPRPKSDGL